MLGVCFPGDSQNQLRRAHLIDTSRVSHPHLVKGKLTEIIVAILRILVYNF
jgi:hypothetical protein